MIVGVVRERMDQEGRVALTPAGVNALKDCNHDVLIEKGAGLESGFTDQEYVEQGAQIVEKIEQLYQFSQLILRVKEPSQEEYDLLRENQVLFSFLHLAASSQLAQALKRSKCIALAYEMVQSSHGELPLLLPMSEVAGRMSIQIASRLLEKINGGPGVLLGGVPGVAPAKVTIIGGGVVGTNAAKMAVGLGASVTILDSNPTRLRQLDDLFKGRVITLMSNSFNIEAALKESDVLLGAVLIPGKKAPQLVTKKMVSQMKPGSVIIDIAVDQGGCIETIDRFTSHSQPTYTVNDVLHYAVPNIPGIVPRTSTLALTNATLPYILEIANKGWETALKENTALSRAVNVIQGDISIDV